MSDSDRERAFRAFWQSVGELWHSSSDEALLIVGFFAGAVLVSKGGRYLLGLDWFSLIILVVIGCAASVILSDVWRLYVQPLLVCLL